MEGREARRVLGRFRVTDSSGVPPNPSFPFLYLGLTGEWRPSKRNERKENQGFYI